MADISDLANVTIILNTAAFQGSSFSTMAILYDATSSDTTPHIVASQASALTASSMLNSDWAYGALGAAFSQAPGPQNVLLIPRAAGQTSAVALTAQLATANMLGGFYGFVSKPSATLADQEGLVVWAGANKRLYVGQDVTGNAGDPTNVSDLCTYTKTNTSDYAAIIAAAGASDEPPNSYPDAAWMAACFAYTPGSENWANQQLLNTQVSPFNPTQHSAITAKNGNTYEAYGSSGSNTINLTCNGFVGSGERIDVIRFRDYLANDIKIRCATALLNRPKLPYTDQGISVLKSQVVAAMENGINVGGISPSAVASDGVTLLSSYTVGAPLRANVSTADVAARTLNGLTFTARLAGAINNANVTGTLTYT